MYYIYGISHLCISFAADYSKYNMPRATATTEAYFLWPLIVSVGVKGASGVIS